MLAMSPNAKAVIALAIGTLAACVAGISALLLGAIGLAMLLVPRVDFPARQWLQPAAYVVVGVPLAVFMFRYRTAMRRIGSGACPKCGYDLRASKGRCPECGTPIHSAAMAESKSHQ